jgi:hypothetical protein
MVTNRENSIWNVNFLKVSLGVFIIFLLNKSLVYLAPHEWYFTFGALLFGYPQPIAWQAIFIKFAIPVITGFLLGFISQENAKGIAGVAGFLSSFILAWPALIAWEFNAPIELIDRQHAFQIVYLLYFAAYSYLSIVGARFNSIYLSWYRNKKNGKQMRIVLTDLSNWKDTIKPILIGAISSVLATVLGKAFSK